MNFTILSINAASKTMVIDWGYAILNHSIPLVILENPEITQEAVIQQIEYMRPPEQEPVELPNALLVLSSEGQGIESETIVENEVTL